MDPDETMRELRELVQLHGERGLDAAEAEKLVELFDALDGWLSGGGFLPGAWAGAGRG